MKVIDDILFEVRLPLEAGLPLEVGLPLEAVPPLVLEAVAPLAVLSPPQLAFKLNHNKAMMATLPQEFAQEVIQAETEGEQ